MYLEKIDLQGFKTFAQKTTLEFLPPHGGTRGITAIVGPNGSGKSNIADSVRWALGEQSLKLLRGKKSEDVIFSGTEKRPRAGFAEVSLHLNNEDKSAPIDLSQVVLTRRLYRDSNSEYLLNGKQVRLTDIQILLAQANFGQRTYSVIGQGMVDHVLVASPQERKEFFDEAAGVKQFEIKRNQAVNKLETTEENLRQAQNLLHEIEPRLRSLSRQVKRLEQRGPLEDELRTLGRAYFGNLWRSLEGEIKTVRGRANEIEARRTKKSQELDKIRKELESMEREETKAAGLLEIQKEYESASRARNDIQEQLLRTEHAIALAALHATKPEAVPVARVIAALEELVREQEALLHKLEAVKTMGDLEPVRAGLRALNETARSLLKETAGGNAKEVNEKLATKQKTLATQLHDLEGKLATLQERIKNYAKAEAEEKSKFFSVQRTWEEKHTQLTSIDQEASGVKVELARLETRRESLIHEIKVEMGKSPDEALAGELPKLEMSNEEAAERFRRLKTQLEMIGGIDPETLKEYEETKTRHDFLKTQTEDLEKAIADLESAIRDLDEIIEKRAEEAFRTINEEFGKYFKRLFGGGHAALTKTEQEEDEESDQEDQVNQEIKEEETLSKRLAKHRRAYSGIEIQATPPGKRLKAINMLSGGERALTSIALICAIMATNPSPFVVLDEVDAALDESNSIRFAEIVEELAGHTQFIIITHNRETMQKANVLYGVTMSDDGVSRLLSLKLEEAERIREGERISA